ncbi:MAG TPA: D-hexose-6-phosphate mutarotase [Roseiflexaceae bacterium]
MSTPEIQALNDQYAIGEHITFAAGPGGLPVAEIRNAHAAATIALQGGHVVAFQPHRQAPVLFVSRNSLFEAGKTIRGGIPVCWPWFAQHPTDPSRPFHGFARTAMWQVRGAGVGPGDTTELRLGLHNTEATWAIWPHAFDLEIAVTVGPELHVALVARNTGGESLACGGALHSYFAVGDAARIAIRGLEGCAYADKVDGGRRKIQDGPITIGAETDRIYMDTSADCVIDDPALARRIRIAKSGSQTTVVWNPWVEKARSIADFADDEYAAMVCVETANAAADVVTIEPGGEHRLSATIAIVA